MPEIEKKILYFFRKFRKLNKKMSIFFGNSGNWRKNSLFFQEIPEIQDKNPYFFREIPEIGKKFSIFFWKFRKLVENFRPSTFSGSSATWCIGAGEVCERPNAEPQRLLRWDGRLRAGGLCKLVCIATGSGFQLCVLNYVNYYDFQVSTFNMQLSSFNMQLSSEFSTFPVRLVTG